jgi:hypothetical protein
VKNILKKQTEKIAQDNLTAWLGTQTYEIELRDDIAETGTCSICGTVFKSWGNNEAPINFGRCCNDRLDLMVATVAKRILVRQTN